MASQATQSDSDSEDERPLNGVAQASQQDPNFDPEEDPFKSADADEVHQTIAEVGPDVFAMEDKAKVLTDFYINSTNTMYLGTCMVLAGAGALEDFRMICTELDPDEFKNLVSVSGTVKDWHAFLLEDRPKLAKYPTFNKHVGMIKKLIHAHPDVLGRIPMSNAEEMGQALFNKFHIKSFDMAFMLTLSPEEQAEVRKKEEIKKKADKAKKQLEREKKAKKANEEAKAAGGERALRSRAAEQSNTTAKDKDADAAAAADEDEEAEPKQTVKRARVAKSESLSSAKVKDEELQELRKECKKYEAFILYKNLLEEFDQFDPESAELEEEPYEQDETGDDDYNPADKSKESSSSSSSSDIPERAKRASKRLRSVIQSAGSEARTPASN